MSSLRKMAVFVALIVIGGVVAGIATGQRAQQERPSSASTRLQADGQTLPKEIAHLQIDAFKLTCPAEKLADLDLDKLTADVATPADLVTSLSAMGTAHVLFRVDEWIGIGDGVHLSSSSRVPVVQDIAIDKTGKKNPSISYNDVGYILNILADWSEENPDLAVGRCEIEVSSLAPAVPEIAPGIRLPVFANMKLGRGFVARNGIPVYTMASNVSEGIAEGTVVHVLILRVVMSR